MGEEGQASRPADASAEDGGGWFFLNPRRLGPEQPSSPPLWLACLVREGGNMAASHPVNTAPHLDLVCYRSPDLFSYCSRPISSMLGTPVCLGYGILFNTSSWEPEPTFNSD